MKRRILGATICLMISLSSLTMIVSANSPPISPTIEGPSQGNPNTEYEFRLCSTDPDGDDISYCIDWGDGSGEVCVGPFPSGACITEKHSWSSETTYTITVKARDTNGAESDPTTHSITLPKNKVFNPIISLLQEIMQRFVLLESIYQLLIK